MGQKRIRMIVFGLAVAALSFTSAVFAQMGPGPGRCMRMGGPRYDPSTEITVKGNVESVDTMTGRRGWSGTHLILKTDKGTFDVHLGPSAFLKDHGFNAEKGDQVEVTGSKIRYGRGEALIARKVRMGEATVTLRDEQGFPLWSRGAQRATPAPAPKQTPQ